MEMDRLGRGEMIAGISGLALLIIAVFIDWFSLEGFGGTGFEFAGFIRDLVLFLTIVGGIGIAVLAAMSQSVNSPVAPSALVAGIAILNTILILIWVIDPPDAGGFGFEISVDRSLGLWLGLIASGGVAYGGWVAMQEEGASYGGGGGSVAAGGGPPAAGGGPSAGGGGPSTPGGGPPSGGGDPAPERPSAPEPPESSPPPPPGG
jgi:hypothetical protein